MIKSISHIQKYKREVDGIDWATEERLVMDVSESWSEVKTERSSTGMIPWMESGQRCFIFL